MRKRTTDTKAAPKAATFLDHTLENGAIRSTRLQRLDEKELLLEVGREYLSGMRRTGGHVGSTLPYTVRHDWPTVVGLPLEKIHRLLRPYFPDIAPVPPQPTFPHPDYYKM